MGRDTTIGVLDSQWTFELGASSLSKTVGSHSLEGGGTVGGIVSQSLRGGGVVGGIIGQSLRGGGATIANVTLQASTNGGDSRCTQMSLWLKVTAFPASDMTIWDFYAGASGYMRAKLTSAGHIVFEGSYNATTFNADPLAGAINTSQWTWLSTVNRNSSGNNQFFSSRIASSSYDTGQVNGTIVGAGTASANNFSAQFSLGVSLSSSYLAWPNSAGWQLSKAECFLGNGLTPIAAPTADISPSGQFLYMMRDTLGAESTIADTSGNSFTLGSGAQGMTIIVDGPYAT